MIDELFKKLLDAERTENMHDQLFQLLYHYALNENLLLLLRPHIWQIKIITGMIFQKSPQVIILILKKKLIA